MSALTGLFCIAGLTLLTIGFTRSFSGLNPIGNLLSPNTGIWRHHSTSGKDVERKLQTALQQAGYSNVQLEFDENDVPHLQAETDEALYFAQGFVTAYFRLWQMDFLSRITAGTVAEILGAKALPIDRFFRRMRIPPAAHASYEMMMADPVTSGPLTAYTKGVNARLGEIDETSLPIEYRLFGLKPAAWNKERAAYLLKFMTWELTGYLYDFRMTATKLKLSQDVFQYLFPLNSKVPSSILGDVSSAPDESDPKAHHAHQLAIHDWEQIPEFVQPDPSNGSNNWAVPAAMMDNHRALLANDLHLGYTLPALWFPIQLTTPTMNVYGASLPGAPGVIVGFTESMGWAVTNGSDDVLDWYSLRYRDNRRQEYLFDNSWRPVVTRDEVIQIAGGGSETIKTRETHVGPIVFDEGDAEAVIDIPAGLAVQWTGFTPSNELRSFLLLNRGEIARDCLTALKGYVAPSQNFVCADRGGRLVYRHAGVFPKRLERDGRFIFEATESADVWQGMLSNDDSLTRETTSDIVVTANQAPFNGDSLSRYGWFYTAPFRALQIRAKIGEKKSWKPEDMIRIQADTVSWLAQNFKRVALREVPKEVLDGGVCSTTSTLLPEADSQASLRYFLEAWNGEHDAERTTAPLMHRWLKTLESEIWTPLLGASTETYWPGGWRFYELLEKEPNSNIWDDPKTTTEVETLRVRLTRALTNACTSLKTQFGSYRPTWNAYQATLFKHSGRIPGLGRTIPSGGVAESIFANKGEHGPTWKMIVSFEDQPKAWMMIPGGQSGDPSSAQYDNRLEEWSRGEMRPVNFKMRGRK